MENKDGKRKKGLFFFEREGVRLVPKIRLPVTCVDWNTERWCSICGKETCQQFVEFDGRKDRGLAVSEKVTPIRMWYCTECQTMARTRSRP